MVIWAYDNQPQKNQMFGLIYTEQGCKMIASVGYTNQKTDYNINLQGTPFVVEVNNQKLTSGKSQRGGTSDVDFVLAAA